MRLVAIGLAAGILSGLFGVGGGVVIVPLLVFWLAYDQRVAAATSLAAIGLIAASGALVYAFAGKLHLAEALLVGTPGAVGAAYGAALQQRLTNRVLTLLFSLLLAVIAVHLLVT